MALEARDVSFSYGGAPVLQGVSLTVEPGRPIALSAPSGFGKTTLCRILAGYLQPHVGTVLVDGAPLPRRGPSPVQLIGQHPERALDPRLRMRDSLAEGVRAGKRAAAAASGEAAARQGEPSGRQGEAPGSRAENPAAQPAQTGPEGATQAELQEALQEALGIRREWLVRFPHELSGGEMQRFCIARALLARPRYLICDEISTMLDAVTQARIWNVVLCQAQEQQLGLVVVSHSAPLLQRLGAQVVDLGQLAEGR
ncbi:ABC transporter ATP-binding protein [Parvibacter caecicola]|uniref:ATP-binding cassette domain-containing protein n=1 Tax=Parvibacter caecicola TaxID=747645 RepID=A0A3N0A818_9ACTN|nr:ATP-binding cassette domain-containing protein [Parvibacter caecicola]MBB3170297.1 peptide/nickel transport system ATP-binding protein [Parvibacter caecicola]MCR2041737.1 ATP-binding cassette domain-containing protein [Parvibacter caecicola]RNL09347.1 ABC transporter ATP-binding protein [Parvibacter caecicola]TJW12461.1 ATP-binding cassette domain-containing protein [Parvibacter caecicola]